MNISLSRLQNELQKWDIAKASTAIPQEEIADLVNSIDKKASQVFEKYVKQAKTGEISETIDELKTDILEIKDLLEANIPKRTHHRVHHEMRIIFQSPKKECKAVIDDLLNKLNNLENQIAYIQMHERKTHRFVTHIPKTKFSETLRDLSGHLVKPLAEKIRGSVFVGYRVNQKRNFLLSQIDELYHDKNKLDKEIGVINQKLYDIDIKLEKQLKYKQKNKLYKLSDKLDEKLNKLNDRLEIKVNQLNQAEDRFDRFIKNNLEWAKEARMALHKIGGEGVRIDLPQEEVRLDGMYMSCQSFRETLANANAKPYELSLRSEKLGLNFNSQGILFDKEDLAGSDVMPALEKLGLFSKGTKPGAGWCQVELDDKILCMPDEEVENLMGAGVFNNFELLGDDKYRIDSSLFEVDLNEGEIDLEKLSQGGTVLLTSGTVGTYEMHKKEILGFLIRGMNVMAFNFRGYGESSGVPGQEGLKRDMEAAYQYLKTFHGTPDNKIMVKGLSMSSGLAAYLAAAHPDVNLFIDQGYADFRDIAGDAARIMVENYVEETNHPEGKGKLKQAAKRWLGKPAPSVASFMTRRVVPAWKTEKEIGKVKGKIAILLTTEDELIKDRDIIRNYQALKRVHKEDQISIFSMPGRHGESWLKVKCSPDIAYKEDREIDELVQKFREEHPRISKYDRFVPSYDAEDLAKKVEEDSEGKLLTQDLLFYLDEVIKQIERGDSDEDINELINSYTEEVMDDPALSPDILAFLQSCVARQDPLLRAYHDVVSHLKDKFENEGEDLQQSLKYVRKLVNKAIHNLPKPLRKRGIEFFSEAITTHIGTLQDTYKERHLGRIQMDEFLETANLKGEFI